MEPDAANTVLGREVGRYTTRAVLSCPSSISERSSLAESTVTTSAGEGEVAGGVSRGEPSPHEADTSELSTPPESGGMKRLDLHPKAAAKNASARACHAASHAG